MQPLGLPTYEFRYRKSKSDKIEIFDDVRKRFVSLTPEEWVRQNFVKYLISEKQFPASLIGVEIGLTVNELSKRCDIVLHNNTGSAKMIVECKAPEIVLNQGVFDQVARYNIVLKVDYLIITNGLSHFCCKMNYAENSYTFLREIPLYSEL